ncbi:MAG: ATP-binding protein [Acidobacteriota bacterium]
MSGRPLRQKLTVLIAVRLIVGTLLLGSAILVQLSARPDFDARPLYGLIGVAFGLSAIASLSLRLVDCRPWLVDLQLALDALLISAFVWTTGGVTSYFSTLYVLPIIGAATIQHRRGAVLQASASSLLYALLVVLQYSLAPGQPWTAWGGPELIAVPVPAVAQYTVVINMLGLLAVGWLSGSLAERLRRADVRLADASTEIANLQAFNQRVIDSLTMGLVTTDLAGRMLTFNPAASAITGHSSEVAIGQFAAEVLQLPPAFVAELEAERRDPGNRRADYRYRRTDGREIDLGLSATPLQGPTGTAGLLFTFQDVTKIRRLERDARLQQRLAAVGEMAAGIAHEIRNPLASMSGSIQILRDELLLSQEQAQLLDIVLRESGRLNQTIQSFLAYARPQRFNITTLDLRRVVGDTAVLLRNSSEVAPHHTIDVNVPDDAVKCDADEGQIRQILWNLSTNGLRAMPTGGRLRLTVRQGAGGSEAVLIVADEGVGIAEEDLDSIFQPFHSTFSKGSGLGLAVVHRIVRDYEGEIQVTSKPGAGTIVEVRLPVREAGTT